ncbi:hypothetical protein BC829DRAFT_434823, partial [Chytridium lagenaria]
SDSTPSSVLSPLHSVIKKTYANVSLVFNDIVTLWSLSLHIASVITALLYLSLPSSFQRYSIPPRLDIQELTTSIRSFPLKTTFIAAASSTSKYSSRKISIHSLEQDKGQLEEEGRD